MSTGKMVTNGSVRDIIQNGENFDSLYSLLRTSGDTYGMTTFDQSLMTLYETNVITRETVLKEATSREDVELQLRGVGT